MSNYSTGVPRVALLSHLLTHTPNIPHHLPDLSYNNFRPRLDADCHTFQVLYQPDADILHSLAADERHILVRYLMALPLDQAENLISVASRPAHSDSSRGQRSRHGIKRSAMPTARSATRDRVRPFNLSGRGSGSASDTSISWRTETARRLRAFPTQPAPFFGRISLKQSVRSNEF